LEELGKAWNAVNGRSSDAACGNGEEHATRNPSEIRHGVAERNCKQKSPQREAQEAYTSTVPLNSKTGVTHDCI
jgi:hypothetical protein